MNKYENRVYRYIKENLEKGFDEDKIRDKLISSGYDALLIENLIEKCKRDSVGFFSKIFPKKVRLEIGEDKIEKPIEIKKEVKADYNPIFKPINKEVIGNSRGLVSRIDSLNEKVDSIININKEVNHKHFSLPYKVRSGIKKLAQKNKVLVMLLRRNRSIDPIITDIKNGFIVVDGIPRNISLDFTFLWKGQNIPTVVIKEWDIEPVGTKDYYEAVKANRIADPMPTGIRMMEELVHMEKGGIGLSPKVWIFIGLGVIALLWVLFGGGF